MDCAPHLTDRVDPPHTKLLHARAEMVLTRLYLKSHHFVIQWSM